MGLKLDNLNPALKKRIFDQIAEDDRKKTLDKENKSVKIEEMNQLTNIDPQELYSEYKATGSVHRAAVKFGTTGETVRRHLKKHGFKLNRQFWTDEEIKQLSEAYSNPETFDIDALSSRLGKTKASIHIAAYKHGLTSERGKHFRTDKTLKSLSESQKKYAQEHPEVVAIRAENVKKHHAEHGHPRGFLGHKHTSDAKIKMSKASKEKWSNPDFVLNSQEHRQSLSDRFTKLAAMRKSSNCFSNSKFGKRDDLGDIHFRSAWEANYARYLNFLIKNEGLIEKWEYEPETFWFDGIKRGCRSYKPDFKVFFKSGKIEYHEVKGWMYPRAKTALKRMKKYHPNIFIDLIDSPRYNAIKKSMKQIIPNWE